MECEIWKDVVGYEGLYKVSDLGHIMSLDRRSVNRHGFYIRKGVSLKLGINNNGYCNVSLYKDGKHKTTQLHQIVAMAFLGHEPNGHKLVVNHKNLYRLDNRLCNLEIITNRENTNQKHLKGTSRYVGVHLNKQSNKWVAQIRIGNKRKFLGSFVNEHDAHLTYQKELNNINLINK